MTKLNVYDLLVLQLNVNRKLGNEIKHHSFILEHRIDVMETIKKLLDNNYIFITNKPEISLNYLKVTELKDILRENNLKLSGKKEDLIDRLINSLDDSSLSNLDLPQVYKATSLGKNILEETEYINHFYPHHSITIIDAFNVAENAEQGIEKIEFIYNFYIYVKINENDFGTAGHYAERLSHYFLLENPNEIKRRIYINLSIYLIGMSELHRYDLITHFNHSVRDSYRFTFFEANTFYEKPVLVDKSDKNNLIEVYLEDIKYFLEPDEYLSTKFIKILFAKLEKNNDDLNKQYTDIENYFKNKDVKHTDNTLNVGKSNDVDTKTNSGCLLLILFPLLPLLQNLF